MHRLVTDELGRFRGRNYYLTVAVEPNPADYERFDPYRDAENWCATVHFPTAVPSESDVEIARIDTRNGTPQFDRLFEPAQPKEWLSEEFTLREAERRLAANWRRYAAAHDRHRDG